MAIESSDPLMLLLGKLEDLALLETDRELRFLHEVGKLNQRTRSILRALEVLAEIKSRANQGESREGDAIRAMRILTSLSKSTMIMLLMELGLPNDDDAVLPWRIELKRRKPSRHDKWTAIAKERVNSRLKKQKREDQVVKRVITLRMDQKVTLHEALKIVADRSDLRPEGILSQYFQPKFRSVAAVRVSVMIKREIAASIDLL